MSSVRNLLVTGASGFVGSRLCDVLSNIERFNVTGSVREIKNHRPNFKLTAVGDINGDTDWSGALTSQHLVIHTAARVHVMKEDCSDSLEKYREVNVAGTMSLARQAAAAGIQRFIFISSVKVNGEQTKLGKPFTAEGLPVPVDNYGCSKKEAEDGLLQLGAETGMEIVIIRPTLVYGPGVKGNFASLVQLVGSGLPLPLGSIRNLRSLVALDNLVDLTITCIDHPGAANEIFLAADGEDISTSELLRRLANAKGVTSRLVQLSPTILRFGAILIGKKAFAQRLLGSLQVDISKNREILDWKPPLSLDEGLKRLFVNDQDN